MSSSIYYTYDKAWDPVPSSAEQRLLCGVQRLSDAVILSCSCSFSHFCWMVRVVWGHASGQQEGQLGQWLFPSRRQTEALLPGQQPGFGVCPSLELLEGAVME